MCCKGQCCGSQCSPCEERCTDPPTCLQLECVIEPPCDDGKPCTDDLCSNDDCGDYQCTYVNNTDPCAADGDSCTRDHCQNGQCYRPAPNGTLCPEQDDGNVCTSEICQGGFCTHPAGNQLGNCPDDGNACTDDYCLNGGCIHPCWDECSTTCAPGVWCNPCACQQEGCTVSLSSVTGKPCETKTLTFTADCWPCGITSFEFEPQYPPEFSMIPPWFTISSPSPISCTGGAQTRTVNITIHEDAPPGPVPIRVTGTTASGQTCQATGTVTVDRTYDPVELRLRLFIAPEAVELIAAFWLYDFDAGDNRWFNYNGISFRSFQQTVMTLDPKAANGGPVGSTTNLFGQTVAYYDHPDGTDVTPCAHCAGGYGDWCIVSGATPECAATPAPGQAGNILFIQHWRESTVEVKAQFDARGYNGCEGAQVPALDATLTIHVRQVCENGSLTPIEFRLYGEHDGFPWHELYLNQVMIYGHDPCCTGEGPMSLFPPREHDFEATDSCHFSKTPLNMWQPVPGIP